MSKRRGAGYPKNVLTLARSVAHQLAHEPAPDSSDRPGEEPEGARPTAARSESGPGSRQAKRANIIARLKRLHPMD